ncbi:MAG: hypothetical protein HQL31_01750 [Planctomycetes bacterium]|nr:hypothetical protein [Planctomycetota bacterium]
MQEPGETKCEGASFDSACSCVNEKRKTLLIVGGLAVVLLTVFAAAIFSYRSNPAGRVPNMGQGAGVTPPMGMTQVAFVPPNCQTCPTVTQCFPNSPAPGQQVAFNPACPTPGLGLGGRSWTQVAATQPATVIPPIFRDASMVHAFRGVCSNCHQVMPNVPIPSSASLPHPFRGVCSNCHEIVK